MSRIETLYQDSRITKPESFTKRLLKNLAKAAGLALLPAVLLAKHYPVLALGTLGAELYFVKKK